MVKLLELSSFGFLSMFYMLSSATNSHEELLKTGTLLGLVAFMILQNYRQQANTNKAIEAKDKLIEKQDNRLANLISEQTDATNRLSQCLEDRPCISGDQRIKVKT